MLPERTSSQHPALHGERHRRVSASILSVSAETASRAPLPVPAFNYKET